MEELDYEKILQEELIRLSKRNSYIEKRLMISLIPSLEDEKQIENNALAINRLCNLY